MGLLSSIACLALPFALRANALRVSPGTGERGGERWATKVLPHSLNSASGIRSLAREANCKESVWQAGEDKESVVFQEPQSIQVPQAPYITSIPTFYITRGGKREMRFAPRYQRFSPMMTRIEAVDGKNLKRVAELISRPEATIQALLEKEVPAGVIGCMLSHIVAIHRAFESGAEVALILEDDALPLVSWWHMSLEEFVISLPPKWQAAQMQWAVNPDRIHRSANGTVSDGTNGPSVPAALRDLSNFSGSLRVKPDFRELLLQKRGDGEHVYDLGTGWGTAAYLISRRGMKRVELDTWDEKKGKFSVLGMLLSCRRFSADDCLLGFTDSLSQRMLQEVQASATIKRSRSYRATPPFFLHSSSRTGVHRANICLDLVAASSVERQTLRLTTTTEPGKRKLLLWVPLKLGQATMSRLLQNIRLARSTAGEACCDIFPAFGTSREMVSKNGAPPLERLHLLRQNYKAFGSLWESKYDFVWILDPNLDISAEDVRQALQTVQSSAARVGQPTVFSSSEMAEAPPSRNEVNGSSWTKAALMQEAPLIQTAALKGVLDTLSDANDDGKPFDCSESLAPGIETDLVRFAGSMVMHGAMCAVFSATSNQV